LEKLTVTKGDVTYRVRVGPYAQRSEAEEIAEEIFVTSGHRAVIIPAEPPRDSSGKPS
jgi:cell division protein FtsN